MKRPSKRIAALLSAGVVGLLAAGCSTGTRVTESGSSGDGEKIRIARGIEAMRYRLDNGLRLIVIEDHTSPTFAYQTWYDVGSRDEEAGKTGLAHLFEHMMFKGTAQVPDGEFDRRLEEAGAEGQNAYTTQDHTTYVQELPKDRLELIVGLEADRMKNLVVDEKSFSTEREVVQNERRYRKENNPDGQMYQDLYALAFQKHPYRWPVIGFEEDLTKMSAADARAFYQKYYSPDRAVVVVSGDVKAGRVRDLIEKYYGTLAATAGARPPIEGEPEQKSARRKTLRLNIQVEKLMMAYPIPSMEHEDMPALDMLQTILSGGRSSRLQKALVETGIATEAYAYAADAKDPSLFFVGVSLQNKGRALAAERIVRRELERLAREPVSEAELERARNLINFSYFGGLETNSERARFAGSYESQMNGIEKGPLYHQKLQAVQPAQILAVAQKYMTESRSNTIIGLRKPEKGAN